MATQHAPAEQRRQQLHGIHEDRRARVRERTSVQHLEQQSQPGIATQQAHEAAAQPEVMAFSNHMELRRLKEQFRKIAIYLNCLHMTHSGIHRWYDCANARAGGCRGGIP